MELVQQLKRGARLSSFVRMSSFYNSRIFHIGSTVRESIEEPSAKLKELFEFVQKKIVIPFQNDEYYDKHKHVFDQIFRTKNKNLISVAHVLERRNPALRDVVDPSVLTRGFVKALEMYQFLARKRFLRRNTGESLKAFHLSELPGGFFLALRHFCRMYNVPVSSALHSLRYDPKKYPHAFRDIFNLQKLEAIDYGVAHGDLSKRREVEYFKNKYSNLDIVTGDFGYSLGDEAPDDVYTKIFQHELEIAESILHPRGVLVMKVYLLLNQQNMRMIYSVYKRFGDLHFYKPLYSRFHSFEIYLIARRSDAPRMTYEEFLHNVLPFLQKVVEKIYSMYSLFVYMHSYGEVSQEDIRAVKRLKFHLSEEIAQLFSPQPSVSL